ncbi:TolC family outer membrane protein [Alphaproteobacteria bacterium]|nr:TolC family outer membrane protein [Alphaproteobacteria bacterium]
MNTSITRIILMTMLFALCSATLMAQEEPKAIDLEPAALSLSEAIEHTFNNNPEIKAARAELMATQERFPQALAGWKPTVSADANLTSSENTASNFGSSSGSTSKDGTLSVDQPLFRGGRTLAETKAAKNIIRSGRALLNVTEQKVLLNAAIAYVNILRDQALRELAQNDFNLLAQQLKATRDRFEFGELTKTDVSQAEARLARAESEIIETRGNLKTSEAAFLKTVGKQPVKLIRPALDLPIPEDIDSAFTISETYNPLIISAESIHEASKNDVDNVFGELLPQVGLFGSWNRTYDPQPGILSEQTTRTIGIGATIPLYQAGGTRSRIRAAKNTTNQRYMETIEAKRQVRQNITESWENWQTAKSEISSRGAQVKASAIAEEGVKKEAELGSRTVLDTLDAQQEHLDARVALITAQRNEIVAKFQLLEAIGILTPQTLGFDGKTFDYEEHLNDIKWKIFDTNVDRLE